MVWKHTQISSFGIISKAMHSITTLKILRHNCFPRTEKICYQHQFFFLRSLLDQIKALNQSNMYECTCVHMQKVKKSPLSFFKLLRSEALETPHFSGPAVNKALPVSSFLAASPPLHGVRYPFRRLGLLSEVHQCHMGNKQAHL